MKVVVSFFAVACLLFSAGCGSSNNSTPTQPITPVTPVTPNLQSISVTPSNATLWVALNTQQFKATGKYSDGSTKDLTSSAQWYASASNIVVVDSKGLATPTGTGSGTIWAASGQVSGSSSVTVAGLSGAYIMPSGPTLSLTGSPSNAQLSARGTWTDGKVQDVSNLLTWTSSDKTVADVSNSGLITRGANAGYATITATWNKSYALTTAVSVTTQAITDADFDGTYVFLLNGVDTSGPVFYLGTFTADGNGKLAGSVASESKGGIVATPAPFTGSYSVMPDGRGDMTWALPSPLTTTVLRFALMSAGDQGRMILFDPTRSTAMMGAFQKQAVGPFTDSMLTGNYVFKLGGANSIGKADSIVGMITADGMGHVITGSADWNDNGTVNNGGGRDAPLAVSGSYTVNNDGYGSMTLNIAGRQLHFAMFMVSNGLFRLLCTNVDQKLLGQVEQQTVPSGGFTTMDGSYTMLLENGGRAGVFAMAGGLALEPPMGGWSSKMGLNSLEDMQMSAQAPMTISSNGRGTIDLGFFGFSSNKYYDYSFAAYMVSPSRMYWIETDNLAVYSGLVEGTSTGQLGGTYVYMGGSLGVASGTEGSALALLNAAAATATDGTFDGIVDANLPTNMMGPIPRMVGSSLGKGSYAADTLSIGVKWMANIEEGQNLTFYVNSGRQSVMVGESGAIDNPVLDGWMSSQ